MWLTYAVAELAADVSRSVQRISADDLRPPLHFYAVGRSHLLCHLAHPQLEVGQGADYSCSTPDTQNISFNANWMMRALVSVVLIWPKLADPYWCSGFRSSGDS